MPREEGREKLLGGTPPPLGWNWACSHGVCASTEGGYALSSTGPWGLLWLGQLSGSESVALAVPRVNGGLCLPGHDLRPCIKGCQQGRALGPELGQWTGCWGMGCWAGHHAWTPLETSKWHGTLQSSARRVPSPRHCSCAVDTVGLRQSSLHAHSCTDAIRLALWEREAPWGQLGVPRSLCKLQIHDDATNCCGPQGPREKNPGGPCPLLDSPCLGHPQNQRELLCKGNQAPGHYSHTPRPGPQDSGLACLSPTLPAQGHPTSRSSGL